MKSSIITVSFFAIGLLIGVYDLDYDMFDVELVTRLVLFGLMFLVGVSIGSDKNMLRAIAQCNFRIILVPLATIIGTLLGAALVSGLVSGRSLTDCLAVSSGFGYYSLSSILITDIKGVELGTVAITSNIIREIFTLLFAPLLVRWFSPLAPITAGGATTMDSTLPIIAKYSGKEWVIVAVTHGILVDLTVPFLVTLFSTL